MIACATTVTTAFSTTLRTFGFHVVLFLPDAVVDQLTLDGPVFFCASFLDIFEATSFGLHAG
jgi:hypothetical protein